MYSIYVPVCPTTSIPLDTTPPHTKREGSDDPATTKKRPLWSPLCAINVNSHEGGRHGLAL